MAEPLLQGFVIRPQLLIEHGLLGLQRSPEGLVPLAQFTDLLFLFAKVAPEILEPVTSVFNRLYGLLLAQVQLLLPCQ